MIAPRMWSSRTGLFSGGRTTVHIITYSRAPAAAAIRIPNAEGEGETDAEQAEHEQPVGPGGAGDAVVEPLEGAVGAELQEPLGGAAAVDPGGVTEAVQGPFWS